MRVSGCGWFRGAARRGAPSRSVPWTVPVSALRHQAERRAGKGTPTSGAVLPVGPGTARRRRAAGKKLGHPRELAVCGFAALSGRDAGRRPALREKCPTSGASKRVGTGFGGSALYVVQRPALQALAMRWFRETARCRSRTGRRSKRCRRWFRAPARCRGGPTGRTGRAPSVVGAGFALPRDAGQRPALQALSALVSRSRAMPVGDRRSKRCRRWFRAPARCRSETGAPSVVGAGFALPRDAGRRPALQALSALVSRSRAMPVGDRRSKRCRRWFRAPARCRSETGAPSVVGAGFALPRECRSETGAPSVVGAGFALPRDAGRRPALQALSALVSRSRAMPVGDRRSVSW